MNFVDWLRATSKWMRQDRPDIYETDLEAFNHLEDACNMLSNSEGVYMSFASFLLTRFEDDGVIEWGLSKRVSSCDIFMEEGASNVYQHLADSQLVSIVPELAAVTDDLEFDEED